MNNELLEIPKITIMYRIRYMTNNVEYVKEITFKLDNPLLLSTVIGN